MGFPLFRFTLNNATEGSLEISEPGGWDEAILKLERDKEYHSLVEFYEQPLLFYGEDTSHNAGIAYIRNIEETQGPEAIIEITIEISEDEGNTYETLFDGVLDLSTTRETDFYKLECGVLRKDFWAKFFNRKDIPVDLQSTTDLDGGTVSLVDKIVLPLPSQKMFKETRYFSDEPESISGTENGTDSFNKLAQVGVPYERSEIEDSFNILFGEVTSISELVNVIEVQEYGDINVDISGQLYIDATSTQTIDQVSATITVKRNSSNEVGTSDNAAPGSTTANEVFDLSTTGTITNVKPGDLIYIYLNWSVSLGVSGDTTYEFGFNEIDVKFTQNSFVDDTQTDAYLIKDAAESILSKYIGSNNVVLSDYLEVGSPRGCGSLYAIMKGLHVRGYSFTDKPLFLSFNQWWDGINPILNLGLGYEGENIRIEQKSYFYDSTPVLNLDFVNNIERRYDLEKIYKSIQIGYNKWSAESASGVDDPQTKRTWRTNFATIGQDVKFLSEFIAASLAIEQTRRNRIEPGKDWKFDEETMIIAVNDGSPEYVPELDENFDSVTGLLNSDTRYNIRLSCARNFERWKNVFNGCMQWQNGDFVFSAGEGNFDMTSTLDGSDCEANSPESALSENGNIESTNDFLFIPVIYEFEHPLTFTEYKTMRDNRTKAIGVSRTDSGHVACHILNVDYQITHGKANFTVILAENAYL